MTFRSLVETGEKSSTMEYHDTDNISHQPICESHSCVFPARKSTLNPYRLPEGCTMSRFAGRLQNPALTACGPHQLVDVKRNIG